MSILFDLYQQGQINSASNKAEAAKDEAARLRGDVEDLKRKADALTIACQALWEIVRESHKITDEHLLARMEQIDRRDGQVDGRISTTMVKCPKCQRQSNGLRKGCLYCGTNLPVGHVFSQTK